MARPLRFGFKTAPQDVTYEEILAIWQEADSIPALEHAWLFDHLLADQWAPGRPLPRRVADARRARWRDEAPPPRPDGDGQHLPPSRRPDEDRHHDGHHLQGAARLRHRRGLERVRAHEHGPPLFQPGERIRRLNEACEIYKSLCTQHLTTYEGRYYQLKEARSEPKPVQKPYPPIVIGGSGEQLTLRVVAKHADIWNATAQSTEIFQHKVSVLREHCAAIGRDPEEIEYSVQIPVNYDDMGATVQNVQQFVDVGATHLILNLRPPFPAHIVARLADEVIPKVTQR